MNRTPKCLLGVTAAMVIGTAGLLGTGAGAAGATSATSAAGATHATRTTGATGATGAVAAAGSAHSGKAHSGAHCDRAEQDMWSGDPSRNLTGHGCSIATERNRWFVIEIDTLVRKYYKGDTAGGGVTRTETLHNRTVRCMGHIADDKSVNWFGCPPS
ncbi:hypothetical protein ACFV2H_49780 [Streptomyces sp. NPDC059629]|uniref:hypothetical protein n=1 Tax=Streptomyces sp. NPDC059629 TaxID=3346889 RepID=UPI00368BAC2F